MDYEVGNLMGRCSISWRKFWIDRCAPFSRSRVCMFGLWIFPRTRHNPQTTSQEKRAAAAALLYFHVINILWCNLSQSVWNTIVWWISLYGFIKCFIRTLSKSCCHKQLNKMLFCQSHLMFRHGNTVKKTFFESVVSSCVSFVNPR